MIYLHRTFLFAEAAELLKTRSFIEFYTLTTVSLRLLATRISAVPIRWSSCDTAVFDAKPQQ
jgi:hypothetical protein